MGVRLVLRVASLLRRMFFCGVVFPGCLLRCWAVRWVVLPFVRFLGGYHVDGTGI